MQRAYNRGVHEMLKAFLSKPVPDVAILSPASKSVGRFIYVRCGTSTSTRVSQMSFEKDRELINN